MTPKDVSLSTGIGAQTVYRHLHTGQLVGSWNGSRWNITKHDAATWYNWMITHRNCSAYPADYFLNFLERFELT